MNELLQVNDLAISFKTYRGVVKAVRNVSFSLSKGQSLGIVGESGCGKSVTAHAIMGLLPKENSSIDKGHIVFDGVDLVSLNEQKFADLRGNKIAMIFQDPMTCLNPVLSIGTQIKEVLFVHKKLSDKQATKRTVELLELVGIPFAKKRLNDYPHQFSGGMRQRVMIAMALACEPDLLIADEPTTALDVTVQAQILELLNELKFKTNTAIIMISHDLGVIAKVCDYVAVMYAGQIVEKADVKELFYNPKHPYTKGLLKALPHLNMQKDKRLFVIDGQPPDLKAELNCCPFVERCNLAMKVCEQYIPDTFNLSENHEVKCWLQHDFAREEA